MKTYNKLVRDRIPEILEEKEKEFSIHTADGTEYDQKLREKLQEEVSEFLADNSVEELSDIMEVVYALAENVGSSKEDLERIRSTKEKERGGFHKKIILEKS